MSKRLFMLRRGFGFTAKKEIPFRLVQASFFWWASVAILFFALMKPVFIHAEEKEFSLDIPYQEGLEAEAGGDLDKAVESYRKVLFVDGNNARVQYKLADAYRKKGEPAKAFKEFRLFLKIAPGDARLDPEEKKLMIAEAETLLESVKKERRGVSLLSFFDVNILVITFFLTLAFLIRIIKWAWPYFQKPKKEEAELKEIFVDRYWERQQEKEITGLPVGFFTLLMFLLLVFCYYLTFRIFQNIF